MAARKYIPGASARIAKLRQMLDAIGSKAELEVDGGVNVKTIREVQEAGASVVVVGSAIYTKQHSIAHGVNALRLRSG